MLHGLCGLELVLYHSPLIQSVFIFSFIFHTLGGSSPPTLFCLTIPFGTSALSRKGIFLPRENPLPKRGTVYRVSLAKTKKAHPGSHSIHAPPRAPLLLGHLGSLHGQHGRSDTLPRDGCRRGDRKEGREVGSRSAVPWLSCRDKPCSSGVIWHGSGTLLAPCVVSKSC